MTVSMWLLSVLGLFNDTLEAVFGVPILRFFLLWLLFCSVVSLVFLLVRQARRGRL